MAKTRLQGYVEEGNGAAVTNLSGSSISVERAFPLATVSVYLTGTLTLATVYSDASGTSSPNPFTADANAYWFCYLDPGTYDVTFSGAGIAIPFTLSAILIYAPSVVAPAPSGSDDYATLQALINVNNPLGIEVILRAGIYLVSAELQPATNIPLYLRGAGLIDSGGSVYGASVIKATAAIRSPLAVLSKYSEVSGVCFDANQLASYGLFIRNGALSLFSHLMATNAVLDGFYLDNQTVPLALNDNMRFTNCIALANGRLCVTPGISAQYISTNRKTALTGATATVVAGNATITIAGFNPTTLGIRKGDLVRTGSGAASAASTYVGQIESVTATTIVVQAAAWHLPTAAHAGAGLDFSIGIGYGYNETRHSDNNTNTIESGVWRSNGAAAMILRGLFGSTICGGPLADTNNFFAYVIGEADNVGNVRQPACIRAYSEANHVHGDFFYGQTNGYTELSTTHGVGRNTGSGGTSGTGLLLNGNDIESLASGLGQNFLIVLKRNAGVVQHQIIAELNGGFAATLHNSRVTGASTVFATTPSNNTFTSGAGLLNGATNILVLNTPGQYADPGAFCGMAVIEEQTISGGTVPYRVRPDIISTTFSGVTSYRLALYLTNAITGAGVGWDTTLGGTNGDYIAVRVSVAIK